MMTVKRWTVFAMLVLVAAAPAAYAATEPNFGARTTGDLVELCDPRTDSAMDQAGVNFCHGFTLGAVRVEMQHDLASRSMKLFCLPTPMPSRNAAIAAFVVWARAMPQRLDMPAIDGLFGFLGENFPCGNAG